MSPLERRELAGPAPCPSQVLAAASTDDRPVALISGPGDPELSAWSYAALEPASEAASFGEAQAALAGWAPRTDGDPPFSGGAVGYLGYDQGFARLDRPRPPRADPLGLPPARVHLYDAIYARHSSGRALLLHQPTAAAGHRADRLARALLQQSPEPLGRASHLTPRVERSVHEARVAQLLELIHAGELYQANLSYAVEGRYQGAPEAAFLRLLHAPPPFAAFLRISRTEAIVSASPECFFDRRGDALTVYPIKGTRPRAAEPDEDRALAAALVADPKDRAEHLMIVDLLRNDLGRLARIGSVRVLGLAYLESFPSVHHLTSRVQARVEPGALERVLDALFPGGSITGCPKLAAMEAIDALEGEARGVYTGAIGYLGPDGDARMSIAIRTATFAGDRVRFGVGGGIVADSVPAREWEETVVKARALRAALEG